jgi:hypothetical protein
MYVFMFVQRQREILSAYYMDAAVSVCALIIGGHFECT